MLFLALRHSSADNLMSRVREFEAPLLTALPEMVNGLSLRSIYRKLLNPFLLSKGTVSRKGHAGSNDNSTDLMDTTPSDSDSSFRNCQLEDDPESSHCSASDCEIMEGPSELYEGPGDYDSNKDAHIEEFEFYLKNDKGDGQQQKIEIDELDLLNTSQSRLQVNVHWKQNALGKYDTSMLNNLPEIHKLELVPKGTEDSVALPGCLEAFLKEEPLGPEDMW